MYSSVDGVAIAEMESVSILRFPFIEDGLLTAAAAAVEVAAVEEALLDSMTRVRLAGCWVELVVIDGTANWKIGIILEGESERR